MIIDCGGWQGDSIPKLRERFGNQFVHVFEPFPECDKFYEKFEDIKLHKKAVWIYDGEVDFYMKKGLDKFDMGNSLLKRKKLVGDENEDRKIKVPCVDFSKGLLELGEMVILKMDIEGAEYEVLKKMIKDGSIKLVDTLLIEWHKKKFLIDEQEHQELVDKIKSTNIKLMGWE